MDDYFYDDEVAVATRVRDDWRRDPVYYFKPNKGGQKKAWECTKQNQIYLGGNRAGKTRLLMTKGVAFLVEHPQDPGYAFWPDNEKLRRKGLSNTGTSQNPTTTYTTFFYNKKRKPSNKTTYNIKIILYIINIII